MNFGIPLVLITSNLGIVTEACARDVLEYLRRTTATRHRRPSA
ncbi:hypothetical protein GA0115240_119624 [Streptomyces sp. DvalAA-14]|nr:hypothetical protein GA0115240_119624 [Streptomyces sp. DvalAA-14]